MSIPLQYQAQEGKGGISMKSENKDQEQTEKNLGNILRNLPTKADSNSKGGN